MRVNETSTSLPTNRKSGPQPTAPVVEGPEAVVTRDRFVGKAVPAPAPSTDQLKALVDSLPRPMTKLGGTDYYRLRAEDFKRRHPDLPVPTYYMGYGDKYVNRFTDELYPKLSPVGKEWLLKARLNLQVAIEARLKQDPVAFDRLERDDDAFLEFAYDTHPKAYLDAGLEKLPLKDLVRIGMTPDTRDLATLNGLEQVVEVAAGLAAKKARGYLAKGLTWKLTSSGQ